MSQALQNPDSRTRFVGRRGVWYWMTCVATLTAFGCETSTLPPMADPCEVPGTICTVAGTGFSLFDGDGRAALETSFYFPLDVCFDQLGRPLILDWNNLRIRRINDDGTIETFMGQDFEGFPSDGALAVETPLHHASDIEMDVSGFRDALH